MDEATAPASVRAAQARRGVHVDVRLDAREYEDLVGEAGRRGLTVSAYLRYLVHSRAQLEQDLLSRVVTEVRRLADARLRALVEVIAESHRTTRDRLDRPMDDDEAKRDLERLLRWFDKAASDYERGSPS